MRKGIFLSVLGTVFLPSSLALPSDNQDGKNVSRNETWEGFTPNSIKAAIDAMNKVWYVLKLKLVKFSV